MIVDVEVFLTGLTGSWALNEFDCLFWFGVINWTVVSNDVRN